MPVMTAAAALTALAIVAQDKAALRAAPASTAAVQAQLWQGDLLEVRGTRLDYLQVYDHRIERAGYIRLSQVRPLDLDAAQAPQLLAVLRFLKDAPGSESLGIAYVAAYLKAVPAGTNLAEPFDALGVMAERLAARADTPNANAGTGTGTTAPGPSVTVAGQLETVAQYGVKFNSYDHDGTLQLCYDGDAFRRVAAMSAAQASAEQRARALLALTRDDCIDTALSPTDRRALNRWRAELLDRLEPAAFAQLSELVKNRLRLRRADVWATVAFDESRQGDAGQAASQAAARRALDELAAVNKAELGDDETAGYAEAAIRVGAVRWAAQPQVKAVSFASANLQLQLQPGEPGQTCVRLVDAAAKPQQGASSAALAQRCTYGTVWGASARLSPNGRTLALAVQPLDGWRELWVWRKQASGWTIDVLPPASSAPGLGYLEFAGWAADARGQTKGVTASNVARMLVVRETQINNRTSRRFEILNLDALNTERYAATPGQLTAFTRWADADWKSGTVSVR
jgi:hypothetical protein